MDDILTYLELVTQPKTMGSEHTAAMRKLSELENSILKDIPLDDWDSICYARGDVLRLECQECFSRGFRLGVQLVLAGLGS